jgi:hypothetical protein
MYAYFLCLESDSLSNDSLHFVLIELVIRVSFSSLL